MCGDFLKRRYHIKSIVLSSLRIKQFSTRISVSGLHRITDVSQISPVTFIGVTLVLLEYAGTQ